jgi:hypothetical protein
MLRIQVPGRGGELHELLPVAASRYVDSRSLVFAAESEELDEFITASQAAKMLRHPEAEAYLFVVRKEDQSELDVQPINFASNETLTWGHPPTVSTSRPDPLRAVLVMRQKDCYDGV